MSITAGATLSITCPDWCKWDAQHHADHLHEWDGLCIHQGVVAVVEDTTGRGAEWSPWEPASVIVSPAIEVGVTALSVPTGRSTHTPGIKIDDGVHPIEQIETLIVVLQRAVELAREQHPDWKLDQ